MSKFNPNAATLNDESSNITTKARALLSDPDFHAEIINTKGAVLRDELKVLANFKDWQLNDKAVIEGVVLPPYGFLIDFYDAETKIQAKRDLKPELGNATSEVKKSLSRRGYVLSFQNGTVFFKTKEYFAYEVHGAILEKYTALGQDKSWLGFPRTDELISSSSSERYSSFEKGTIRWSPTKGAFIDPTFDVYRKQRTQMWDEFEFSGQGFTPNNIVEIKAHYDPPRDRRANSFQTVLATIRTDGSGLFKYEPWNGSFRPIEWGNTYMWAADVITGIETREHYVAGAYGN